MSVFKKGDKVVKILRGGGVETATIQFVNGVKKGKVLLEDSSLEYDAKTGQEIDPVIPGFSSRLVMLEE